MTEGIELPEPPEHGSHPLTIPVSVTISTLAVLGTIVTLLGHRAHTEELLLQAKASDQWNYYQAKDIRLHEMEAVADMVGTLAPLEKERATAVQGKYLKEVDRYRTDREKIRGTAEELETERDVIGRRADRFDGGEALLEVGLVICSVTLLTKRRAFWLTGMLFGAAGVVMAATGFLFH
jgi:Domain of unknown function (DUF4337)